MQCSVVLVQPPIRDAYLSLKRTIPYGLIRIAACLRQANISVGLVDALATKRSKKLQLPNELSDLNYLKEDIDRSPFSLFTGFKHFGLSYTQIAKRVANYQPQIIGISSLFSAYAEQMHQTIVAIKKECPNSIIVVGGHHASECYDDVFNNPAVDYVIRGEGEFAFTALCKAILERNDSRGACPREKVGDNDNTINNSPLSSFQNSSFPRKRESLKPLSFDKLGIISRDDYLNQRITPQTFIENLNTLPLPALDLVDSDFYSHRDSTIESKRAVIVTSRGCRLRCSYCSFGHKDSLPFRQANVETIIKELDQAIVDYGARFIDFEDENLSWDKARFHNLLDQIIERYKDYPIELRAMNGLLPRTLDYEIIAKMKKAGFKSLNLALGSSHQERLLDYMRPDERIAFDRALDAAEAKRLDAVGYIIAAGPNQNAEESLDDLIYLAKRRVLIGLSIYYPSPGSALFEKLKNENALPPSPIKWRSTALPIRSQTTKLQSLTLLRVARLINFIKSEIDAGKTLPKPTKPSLTFSPEHNRKELGRTLLSFFLYDQKLRAIDHNGNIHEHQCDQELLKRFSLNLKKLRIKGICR